MSIAALNWAWGQTDLSSSTKLVLVALADRANEDTGECWPGLESVAKRACMSTRQVSRHLTKLTEAGLISRRRIRRDDGTLGKYVFRVNLDQPTLTETPPDTDDQWTDATSGHSGSSPPDIEGPDHRTSVSAQEATHSEPSQEPRAPEEKPAQSHQAFAAIEDYIRRWGRTDPDRPPPPPWMLEVTRGLGGLGAFRRGEVDVFAFREHWKGAA